MIIFKTPEWSWDITNYGLDFTEESPYFEDVLTKSFSFPINLEVNEDTAYRLGLVTINGITNYSKRIYGTLIIDDDFFEAYISINNIKGDRVELTYFYGNETLSVFDKELKNLPFKVSAAPNNDLSTFAVAQLNSSWPQATHQFVSVFRDELTSKSNYKAFEGWMNNMVFDDNTQSWSFVENTNEQEEGNTVAVNRNVMTPMPYLLEILKIGFKTEGKDIRGELVNDSFFNKVLLVPQNFMEQFAVTQFDNYSFAAYTQQEQLGSQTLNVYQRVHTPQNEGSYSLKIKINMSPSMAQYFSLTVTQNANTLYEVFSENTNVNINETVELNIVNTQVFDDIIVTMKLVQQSEAISAFNTFTYEYKEGQLNIFPSVYTIADYMPDLNFREFFNKVKNWLNLDPVYTENAVYLNFLENAIDNFRFIDRSHLEQPEPLRDQNQNNLFKLYYNDEDQVLVNKDGQTFDDTDFTDQETSKIQFEVLPLDVTDNFGKVTAVYPEDEEDIMLILFNGPIAGENLAVKQIDNRTFSVQDIYNWFWQKWLTFRANSETVKDSFYMHATESINLREGEFKYNTKRLILSLRKRRVSTEWYKVEVTAETF